MHAKACAHPNPNLALIQYCLGMTRSATRFQGFTRNEQGGRVKVKYSAARAALTCYAPRCKLNSLQQPTEPTIRNKALQSSFGGTPFRHFGS
jgi:hypothetical protein